MPKLQQAFMLTDKGYKDLKGAIAACTLTNFSMMIPFGISIQLIVELLKPLSGGEILWSRMWMLFGAGILGTFIIFLCSKNDYKKTYVVSYTEAENTRISLAEHIRKLPMSLFNSKDLTELTTNFMGDVATSEHCLSHIVPQLVANFISIAVITVFLAFFDWRMAIALFISVPVAFAVVVLSRRIYGKLHQKHNDSKLAAAGQAQEYIEGIKVIHVCNLDGEKFSALENALRDMTKMSIQMEFGTGIFVAGAQTILQAGIRTTLEVMDGDLYIVVTGCMVEMIGDDVKAVAAEFADGEVPVIAIPTPSFQGNSYDGYDMVLEGLFRHYVKRGLPKREDTVNLLGLVPGQDVFYKGNLAEIKRLLERLGLRVNTFFGEGETLENLQNASQASLNIVLSDLYGIKAARAFEELHGTPYRSLPLPVGAAQTAEFLSAVSQALHIDKNIAEQVIRDEEARYYDYLERTADIYNDVDLQRYAVVAGDANYAPAVSRFLADELGWIPRLTVVTDFLGDAQKRTIENRFQGWESSTTPLVVFDTDTSAIQQYLPQAWEPGENQRYYDSFSPTVLVGSVFERDLAAKFGFPLLTLSFPVTNRVVLNQTYAGYNGGLSLASDLLSILVAGR